MARLVLPIKKAAAARGLTEKQLRSLARKHGNSFVARPGTRGRGRAMLVDMKRLDAIRGVRAVPSSEADKMAGVLARLPDVLAKRFAEAFYSGSVTSLGLKPVDGARAAAFFWHRAKFVIQLELDTAGVESVSSTQVPEEIARLGQF